MGRFKMTFHILTSDRIETFCGSEKEKDLKNAKTALYAYTQENFKNIHEECNTAYMAFMKMLEDDRKKRGVKLTRLRLK